MKYVKAVKAIQKETNSRIQFTYTTFVFVKSELCTCVQKYYFMFPPTNIFLQCFHIYYGSLLVNEEPKVSTALNIIIEIKVVLLKYLLLPIG